MPGVANRRCYTCGSTGSHTHGMHYVTDGGSFYFCRSKCRSSFERGRQRKRPRKQVLGAVITRTPAAALDLPPPLEPIEPTATSWDSLLPRGTVLAQLVSWFERVLSKTSICSAPAAASTPPPPQPLPTATGEGGVVAPQGLDLSWDILPGSIILDILPQLDLPDLLNMACVCRHWFQIAATAARTIHTIDACDDESRWSRTIHLLPRVMPEIKTLSVTLHPPLTCRQIQVLSRYTLLEHLKLTVCSDRRVDDHEEYWMPALARLTQLQSLEITVPGGTFQLECLSSLSHLTRLNITNGQMQSNSNFSFSCVDNMADTFKALSRLSALQSLTFHQEMLPSCDITQLSTLTSLTIKQANPYPCGFPDMDAEIYMKLYIKGLGCLPCLRNLRLEFQENKDFLEYRRVSDTDLRAMWLTLFSQYLTTVPQLELYLSSDMRLVANDANVCRLASLTNLTALDVTFTDFDISTDVSASISRLSTLTNLTSLRTAAACRVMFNISYQQMHSLCSSLSKLTQLKINLRPDCFQSAFCLTSLNMLTDLKVLELGLPLDVSSKEWAEPEMQLPWSCRLDRLTLLVLEGYSASYVHKPFVDTAVAVSAAVAAAVAT